MLHYDQPSLKLTPGDGRSIGENVEKSFCARRKTGHLSKLPGIPATMVRCGWHLNRRYYTTRSVCTQVQRGLNVDVSRERSDQKMGHYFCRPQYGDGDAACRGAMADADGECDTLRRVRVTSVPESSRTRDNVLHRMS
jgi:hypothetical protein